MTGVPESERILPFPLRACLDRRRVWRKPFPGPAREFCFSRGVGEQEALGTIPLFLPDESESTFAEISLEEKAKISHRARALAKLVVWLENREEN